MKKIKKSIPADVPKKSHEQYLSNYNKITHSTGNLFLFAADHKLEHLNDDFVGPTLDPAINNPEHLFKIAQNCPIGAMATQLGLISQYGQDYPGINYIAKITGKTNLVTISQAEPNNAELNKVNEVIDVSKESGLNICGIGLTVYIGSEYEGEMLKFAAKEIHAAHQHGLLAILWVYPRGKAVKNPIDPHLLAGAVGVATALGADFVKIQPPKSQPNLARAELLKEATGAAGKTGIICAGGDFTDEKELLRNIYEDINTAEISGCAIGRNLFQRSLSDAHELAQKIAEIVYGTNKNR